MAGACGNCGLSFHPEVDSSNLCDECQKNVLGIVKNIKPEAIIMSDSDKAVMKCPACGSDEVKVATEKRDFNALYGPSISVDVALFTCGTCKETGSFDGKSDRAIQQALEVSALQSVPDMVKRLRDEHNCHPPYIERVTGLPFGSITRCEAGHYDAAVIIALRMALTYPPVLRLLDDAWT